MIKRKASFEEIFGNFAQERERFDKEFLRAENDRAKVYLMVEDMGSYSSIISYKYNTQFASVAFMATFQYYAREMLK